VDGTWEHIDMNMFLSSHVYLPMILGVTVESTGLEN
jgi:hypothetical protein